MKTFRLALFVVVLGLVACNAQEVKNGANGETSEPAPSAPAAPAEPTVRLTAGEPSALAGKVAPADVDWLVVADLRALEGTLLERQFRPWLKYLNSRPEYLRAEEKAGAGPLLGHAFVVGGVIRPELTLGSELFGAVFGLKTPQALADLTRERLAREGGPPELAAYRTGIEAGAAWGAGPDLAGKVEAVLKGEGKSLNDNEDWVALQKAINPQAPLWALVRIPEIVRSRLSFIYREVPGLPYFPGAVELLSMTHAALSIDLGNRLEVRLALRLESAEAAQVVVEQLRMAAEATLWEPTLLFELFQFEAEGPMVRFAAATSEKAWRVAVFWASVGAQVAAYEEMR